MKNLDTIFTFSDDIPAPFVSEFLVAEIPAGIRTSDEIFTALTEHLELPGYFGRNWNALSDCLRDLHWVKQRVVLIRHIDMPDLNEVEARSYLSVLAEAVQDWKQDEPHEVMVIFPKHARMEVLKNFGTKSSPG